MTITPEASAKSLTQLVATEIKVQMARADVRQSQLARQIDKTEQWLSVRLRGRQPIDINDLALIARGLGVGIHDLLPTPEVAATASPVTRMVMDGYRSLADRVTNGAIGSMLSHVHRPPGRRESTGPTRTMRLPRLRPGTAGPIE